jgi:hypothetical protein
VLRQVLGGAGFGARVRRRPERFDLWAVAVAAPTTAERLAELAAEHFPTA